MQAPCHVMKTAFRSTSPYPPYILSAPRSSVFPEPWWKGDMDVSSRVGPHGQLFSAHVIVMASCLNCCPLWHEASLKASPPFCPDGLRQSSFQKGRDQSTKAQKARHSAVGQQQREVSARAQSFLLCTQFETWSHPCSHPHSGQVFSALWNLSGNTPINSSRSMLPRGF